jgi:hypothetical protein
MDEYRRSGKLSDKARAERYAKIPPKPLSEWKDLTVVDKMPIFTMLRRG